MTAIEAVLWPGCRALAPSVSQFGGILARKPGYHNTRRSHLANRPHDYSIQHTLDKQGPLDEASALDWTFSDAHSGNYSTIAKFSKRLYVGGVNRDPRLNVLREFYGNTDNDTVVEGWNYDADKAASSDDSHLWHIHISVHRAYINNAAAMQGVVDVLAGKPLAAPAPAPKPPTGIPTYANGSRELSYKTPTQMRGTDVVFVQRWTGADDDGIFGPGTKARVVRYQEIRGLDADGIVGRATWDAMGY